MGHAHYMVMDTCTKYFAKMRRNVYVTPKSFLSFLSQFKSQYKAKLEEIDKLESNVSKGLMKIQEATNEVSKLS